MLKFGPTSEWPPPEDPRVFYNRCAELPPVLGAASSEVWSRQRRVLGGTLWESLWWMASAAALAGWGPGWLGPWLAVALAGALAGWDPGSGLMSMDLDAPPSPLESHAQTNVTCTRACLIQTGTGW